MEWLDSIVSVANDYLWSYVLIVMLVGVGLMFTVRTKLVQIVQIPEMIRLLFEGVGAKGRDGHDVPSFLYFDGFSRGRG